MFQRALQARLFSAGWAALPPLQRLSALGMAVAISCSMLIVASLLALLIGASLSIMGGGGSLLTVPILRYVLNMEAHQAIAVSMLVVSTTSIAALTAHARHGHVHWRIGAAFGLAGMAGAFLTGRLAHFLPGVVLLSAFALMMFATAFAMLRKPKREQVASTQTGSLVKIGLEGFVVGAITGLLGAGGGFAIVPALVLLAKLPMELAVGTSLMVIAMNSSAGFMGLVGQVHVDFAIAAAVSSAAVVGSIAGAALVGRISPALLKKAFAWFVMAMAVFILAQELPGLWRSPARELAASQAACAVQARTGDFCRAGDILAACRHPQKLKL